MAKKNYYKSLAAAQGNQLRGDNTQVVFYNFSLPAVLTCPHADYCKDICYAINGEKLYSIDSEKGALERKRYANLLYLFDGKVEAFKKFLIKNKVKQEKIERILYRLNELASSDEYIKKETFFNLKYNALC